MYLLTLECYSGQGNLDSNFQVSGGVDVYYLYNFNQPSNFDYANHAFSYHRHNEINLNLGYIKLAYNNSKVRSNLALQTGTYPQANYAAEPAEYRMINEANVGFRLANRLWFDVGVMPSHIGVESSIAFDCYNLTRSIMADGSPYFLTAAKLTYEATDKLELAALVSNGWQIIRENNPHKSYGIQAKYALSEKLTVNYSNFIGKENGLTPNDLWVFNDFWIEYNEILPGLKVTAVFDFLLDYGATKSVQNSLYTSAILLYYDREKVGFGARFETYQDPNNIINSTPNNAPFEVLGYSVNSDFKITQNAKFRLECRYQQAGDNIFFENAVLSPTLPLGVQIFTSDMLFATAALQIQF